MPFLCDTLLLEEETSERTTAKKQQLEACVIDQSKRLDREISYRPPCRLFVPSQSRATGSHTRKDRTCSALCHLTGKQCWFGGRRLTAAPVVRAECDEVLYNNVLSASGRACEC